MHRRSDPEPITIVSAVTGVIGASISAVNYWRSHHKRLPYQTRHKLIDRLDSLSAEIRYLRTDIDDIAQVFAHANFPEGRALRLGNGALLTADEFHRYEKLADRVFARLRKVHSLALKVQRLAFELPYTDKLTQTNATGDAIARADALMRSRDYSIDEAWHELRALAEDIEKMIQQLNSDLGRGP